MSDISTAVRAAYTKMAERKWDSIYYLLDLHGTVFIPDYEGHSFKAYESASNGLKRICALPETKLIIWSSVREADKEMYIKELCKLGVPREKIIGFNVNPLEDKPTLVGDFSEKPYFSVIVDDKAGFSPYGDWNLLADSAEWHRKSLITKVPGDVVAISNTIAKRKSIFNKAHNIAILHGCNCFCTMGKGVAVDIRNRWPAAYAVDLDTAKGDKDKLGTFSSYRDGYITVINAYTQYDYKRAYGESGDIFEYQAFKNIMDRLPPFDLIVMPKIGAGLAGGNWDRIEKIIVDSKRKVLIVDFDKEAGDFYVCN